MHQNANTLTWLFVFIGYVAISLACTLILPFSQTPAPASPSSIVQPDVTQVSETNLPITPTQSPIPSTIMSYTQVSIPAIPFDLIPLRLLIGPGKGKSDQPIVEYQLLDLKTGQASTLIAFTRAEFQYVNWQDISTDGSQALFNLYGDTSDIYRVDFASGQLVNLTNTPERNEYRANWCAGEPTQIFFSATEVDCGECASSPGLVNADGTAYQILDGRNGDASPDCRSIAFDRDLEPWISTDGVEVPLELEGFGVEGSPALGSPAWSPDGKKIVWMAKFSDDEYAPLLIDLEAHSSRILKPFSAIAGHGGWFFPAVWSPDGAYVAFDGETLNKQDQGIWIAGIADPSFILHITGYNRFPIIWSPDGRAILLGGDGYWLVEAATGTAHQLELPDGVSPLAWLPDD